MIQEWVKSEIISFMKRDTQQLSILISIFLLMLLYMTCILNIFFGITYKDMKAITLSSLPHLLSLVLLFNVPIIWNDLINRLVSQTWNF